MYFLSLDIINVEENVEPEVLLKIYFRILTNGLTNLIIKATIAKAKKRSVELT